MQVTLKLYASLSRFLPEGAHRNVIRLDVAENTTIRSILDRYNVPPEACHLVMVNGIFQPPASRDAVALTEGDELAIWPPVAGG